jgi:hypothetical protein
MPFRTLRRFTAPIQTNPENGPLVEASLGEASFASTRRNWWSKTLLLTTSAALGGIAVAIWNRRTLARMRQQAEAQDKPL